MEKLKSGSQKLGAELKTVRSATNRPSAERNTLSSIQTKLVNGAELIYGDQMTALSILQRYFTTGTAEAEEQILRNAFVPVADYVSIINPPYASPRILVARKGSGKSAFVQILCSRMREQKVPVLSIKPEDIIKTDPPVDASPAVLVSNAEQQLNLAIAVEAGSQLKGLITKEHEAQLLTLAETAGSRPRDAVQKLMDSLLPIAKVASKVDFSPIAKTFGNLTPKEVERAILTKLGDDEKLFYLLIDDTDRVAAPSNPNHLNRIWAFFLAARNICKKNPYIRCIVTIRTEVWHRLMRDNAAQRDQVDHFRPLAYFLNPKEEDVRRIVERRLELAAIAAREQGAKEQGLYPPFFEGDRVKIPTSQEQRYWSDFIVKRSRERPRDAIQLIAMLSLCASNRHDSKINGLHVEKSMPLFSEERVDDLKREVDSECPQIKEVIASFSSLSYSEGSFKENATALLKHFMSLPSRFGITLFGLSLKPQTEQDAFKLWRYMFDLGFFGGRVDDVAGSKGYTHAMVLDETDLIAKERWSQMERIIWEINPAYRDFLIRTKERETLGIFRR